MGNTTTLNETLRSPIDGTEEVRLATTGANWKAPISQIAGATFYVNTGGLDTNPGTLALPWKTIAKVNAQTFKPGDSILFQGGQTFTGAIVSPSAGTPAAPITFGSYGGGQATISSGNSNGFTSTNQAGIIVRDLTFTGTASTNIGVHFNNTSAGNVHLQNVQAINLNVSGYGWSGIHVDGNNGSAGYDDVLIDGCVVTACCTVVQGLANIGTAGFNVSSNTGYGLSTNPPTFNNVKVINCISHDNAGVSDTNFTGNGFFMAQTKLGLFDACIAYNNGASAVGGYGFQSNDSISVTAKNCISYSNSDNTVNDGGGFSYDGGSASCNFIDCLSYNNKGAGFSIQSYNDGQVTGTTNCSVLNCTTRNDGTGSGGHNQSGLFIDNDYIVTGVVCSGNTVFQSNSSSNAFEQIGTQAAATTGLVTNNTFTISGAQNFVNSLGNPTGLVFNANRYNSAGAFSIKWNGSTYLNLLSWMTATGQEADGLSWNNIAANLVVTGPSAAVITNDTETHGTLWGVGAEVIGTTSAFNLFGGPGTHTMWVANYDGVGSFQLKSGAVFGWSSNASDADAAAMDTGISRGAANFIYFGNGTPGDFSATIAAGSFFIEGTSTPSINNTLSAVDFTNTLNLLVPNLGTNQHCSFNLGVKNASYDLATFYFLYAGDDSTSNAFGVVFYGQSPVFQINALGALSLPKYTTAGLLQNDASGNVTTNSSGISATITTAKVTPVSGANGSMTFVNGILTAQTQAT